MIKKNYKNSGTVAVSVALLIIAAIVVLAIVRYLWVDSANKYYDKLVSTYIKENENYDAEDRDRLRERLLEGGIFIKMHRWNKESFVKDKKLYNEMVETYNKWEWEKEQSETGIVETLINL